MLPRFLKIFSWIAVLLLSSCSVFSPSYQATSAASAGDNFNSKQSTQTGWLVFGSPDQTELGLVFYPGGKVQPEAYSELANAIADHNVLVVIVPMPFDLAVLGPKRANGVQAHFNRISQWIIGGHSLGGTMAASLAFNNPEQWQGLWLLASYPQEKHDFSTRNLPVLTIIGDQDGLIPLTQWRQSLEQLPANADSLIITGGNHAGFGRYGMQADDGIANISQAQQQSQTVSAFGNWLKGAFKTWF